MTRSAPELFKALGYPLMGLLLVCSVGATSAVAQGQGQGSAPVTIVGPLPVPVTGTVTGTVNGNVTVSGSVHDADNPGRHPFQVTLCATFGITSCPAPPTLTVPSTERLVIEFVSVTCNVTGGATTVRLLLQTTVGTVLVFHRLGPVSGAEGDFLSSQLTKIYADPNTEIRFIASLAIGGPAVSGACTAGISGYFITP